MKNANGYLIVLKTIFSLALINANGNAMQSSIIQSFNDNGMAKVAKGKPIIFQIPKPITPNPNRRQLTCILLVCMLLYVYLNLEQVPNT